jgi:hypothetical protein
LTLTFSLWRWQAADPVEIQFEKLKQEIRQLPVDNLNITIADIVLYNSGRLLGGVLEKAAKAYTVYEAHHDKWT